MHSPPRSPRSGRVLAKWEITPKFLDNALFRLRVDQLWDVLGANSHFHSLKKKYSYLKPVGIRRRAKYIFILKTLHACHVQCQAETDANSRIFYIRWARSVILSASLCCP